MNITKNISKKISMLWVYQSLRSKRKIGYISIIVFNYLDARFTLNGIQSTKYSVTDELNIFMRELYYINPQYIIYTKMLLAIFIVFMLYIMAKNHSKHEALIFWICLLIPLFGIFSWIDLTEVI